MRKKLTLDTKALRSILRARKMSYSDLARKIGWTKENLNYHLKNRTVKGAEAAGEVLGLDPKMLLRLEGEK